MNNNTSFSLSLQKRLENRTLNLDSELDKAFKVLGIKSMLHRCNIRKQKGHGTAPILYLFILLPFLKKCMSCFWDTNFFIHHINAKKDVYYRFLNHERFNWRKFIYFLSLRMISICDNSAHGDKTLIVDDTVIPKTGKDIELVSYHFDHKVKRCILGNRCIQLGYHNGINFFPVDIAFNTSKNRPNTCVRDIDKRTNGWHRRKEALRKRTEVVVEMLSRAWQHGIDASFVLFDSWFSHDAVIAKILDTGYGVICRLKKGRVKYTYQGQKYTLKQLWLIVKKQTQWLGKFQVKAVCVNAKLPKSGDIRILFVSDGKKQWHAFLSTDLELESSQILNYYARRWAIEVFFKDAKQMLYLGKEQSNTFDALVASYSMVMLRYLFLLYVLNKYDLQGPIGPLFRKIADNHLQLCIAAKMWDHIKELMITSSELICHQIEPDIIMYFLDIIEEAIRIQLLTSGAKL